MGWKPESIGAGVEMFAHGAAKLDCVTVWFPDSNVKRTISPTEALMLEGM